MADTQLKRIPREELAEEFQMAWDGLNGLTGEPTFVEVFAQAPDVLRFVMNEFYMKLFFGGNVDQRYKQLVRLKLSLVHGCRTCNPDAPNDVLDGVFDRDGSVPCQVDGGLKCFGHPIGASGLRMAYEIYLQLLGRAGERQLDSPSTGLIHNLGGIPNRSVASVSVLGLTH